MCLVALFYFMTLPFAFRHTQGVSMVYVRLLNGEMPMQDSLVYPTMCIIFTTRPTLRQLRHLHASQAPILACKPWKTQSGELMYLIEDVELRENYGHLIGEIAASHHWDIEVVVERFSIPRPPAHFFQSDWVIDPLKIACMLRVADAGHMDGARAPTFLLKLLEMNSVSKAHWISQNHLGRVFVNPNDPTQLIIASTSPFLVNKAAAWWVAFDAITLFNNEIQNCNEVLGNPANGTHPQFARQSVAGAGNISELKKICCNE